MKIFIFFVKIIKDCCYTIKDNLLKLIGIIKSKPKLRIVAIVAVIILLLLLIQGVAEFFLGQKGKSSSQQTVSLACEPLTLVSLKEYAENSNDVKPIYGEKCLFEGGFLMKLIYEDYQQTLKAKLGLESVTEGERKQLEELIWIIKDNDSSVFIVEGNRLGILVLPGIKDESKVKSYLEKGKTILAEQRAPLVAKCQKVNLGQDWSRFDLTKTNAECTGFIDESNENILKTKCESATAQWRSYFIKEQNIESAKNIKIKADLKLIESTKFFEESGGIGVKGDDYVELLILNDDRRGLLATECNQVVAEEKWGNVCLADQDISLVVGRCGVPKFTDSKNCDFQVKTEYLNRIYFIFKVADAWLADVEGSLSNLEICYEE